MTAIPVVAPPLPERQAEPPAPPAAPEPIESPPSVPPAMDETTELPPRRRRRRMAALLLLLGLLVALTTLIIWYLLFRQPLPIPIIPESQVPAYSSSVYGIDRPTGVTVSAGGERIYVTETGGDRIVRIFDGRGDQVGTMRPPVEMGPDHVPVYLAIDPLTEEVYVTDRPTGSVYVYDRDGLFLREFVPPTAEGGWQPLAIAFDAQGLVYVSDLSAPFQRVLVLDRDGQVVRTLGQGLGLSFPNGIAVDEGGYVYVTDSNNGRLLAFGPDGALVERVGRGSREGSLGLPRGVAVDSRGRVFVADATGQGVFVYRAMFAGEGGLDYLGFFGGFGLQDGVFRYPNDVAVDQRGRVYVTDSANDRVQVWSY
jgi:DNA-binding beta-propeller fold protein YncE